MRKRSRILSLTTKITAMIVVIILLCTIPLGIFAYTVYHDDSIEKHKSRAVSMAQALAVSIDPDEFLRAIETNEKNEYYVAFQAKFDRAKSDLGASFLFAGSPGQGRTFRMWKLDRTCIPALWYE